MSVVGVSIEKTKEGPRAGRAICRTVDPTDLDSGVHNWRRMSDYYRTAVPSPYRDKQRDYLSSPWRLVT